MRRLAAILVVVVAAACAPRVVVQPSAFEEDDPAAGAPVQQSRFLGWNDRSEAAPGEGARSGTIARADLIAVLDRGPGAYMQQFEVTSALDGNRFVGWQLVQHLATDSALRRLDLARGDILVAVNGMPLSRPEQLMALWTSLRSADRVVADLLRGEERFQLQFTVEGADLGPRASGLGPRAGTATATGTAPATGTGTATGTAAESAPATGTAPATAPARGKK